jgi:hypothetical protein
MSEEVPWIAHVVVDGGHVCLIGGSTRTVCYSTQTLTRAALYPLLWTAPSELAR